ncbi:helix-turn-helix transcriptional regulator [Citrobacter werkmanii]|uniref:Helix-turn-helix domain-containing protein n=1 Tax=Kluyvera ascorbata TaxID=51288 RepID=A0AB35XA66_9ENTR|nr:MULTISPECIES: helix-turn-helix domain-containing protein [Enterobacteriaceae]MDU1355161.1 helix-turn-helix domain-containing protein [Citrobacter freundii]MDU1698715.1 helix-turn-helix domain-containing protein [Citrobacter freundii]MDU1734047.1 helix-turn-helix domain-containing protein [Citrobacter freundii]MDU1952581.1 helix-turn-helix domain-containing protein [Atlantibacter hermannii]MDU7723504.1 helix-turn-helix domain-containing protein [Citrobacter sp.]
MNKKLPVAPLLKIDEVCEIINRHRSRLHVWVREGSFPQPVRRNGRAIGFRRGDVEEWLSRK